MASAMNAPSTATHLISTVCPALFAFLSFVFDIVILLLDGLC